MADELAKERIDTRKAVIDYIIEHYLYRDCQIVACFQERVSDYVRANGHGALSKATWEIIYFLCRGLFSRSRISVSDIYSSIDVSKSAVIRYIHRLESWEIVEKKNDPVDRRRWVLFFTPHFEDAITEAVDYCADQYGNLLNAQTHTESYDVLQERLSRFKDFAEVSADWFWETDSNHRFAWLSESHAPHLQVSHNSRIGKKRWDFHRPSNAHERQQMAQHKEELEAHRPFRNFIYRVSVQKDKEVWCATNGNPIFDSNGVFKGYFGSGRDVTDRREILESLRRSEDRLRRVVSLAADGSWTIDRDFRYTWFSNGCRPFLPRPESQVIGMRFWERFATKADWANKGAKEIQDILNAHNPFHDLLTCVVDGSEGRLEWHLNSGVPIFDNKGEFDGYQGVFEDVTSQIRSDVLATTNKKVMAQIIEGKPIHEIVSYALGVIDKLRPGSEVGVYFRSGATFHLFDAINGTLESRKRLDEYKIVDLITEAVSKRHGIDSARAPAPMECWLTEAPEALKTRGNYWMLPFNKSNDSYNAIITIWVGAGDAFGKQEHKWLDDVRQMLELAIIQPSSGIAQNVN